MNTHDRAVRHAWIDRQRRAHPLPAMRATLDVSLSGYQARKRGATPSRKRLTDAQMLTVIRAIHAELEGACGRPRMAEEIRGIGFPASKERVERLMRENGIRARHKRRYKATTDSKHRLPVAPKLLDGNFTPAAPNQIWTAGQSKPVCQPFMAVWGDISRGAHPADRPDRHSRGAFIKECARRLSRRMQRTARSVT
jgi:transposase InsO family protein